MSAPLTSPGPAKGRRAAIAFILATAVMDVMALGIIIPVLPTLIEQYAGSKSDGGVMNGVFVAVWCLMQFVASPIVGSLSDRIGRRPVILFSAAGLAVDYVIMALAPDLWWLLVGRIISGITTSSFSVGFAYLADITPEEGRARAYGLLGAAFSAGFVLGPLLGGLIGELGPRAPFWAAGALSALAFLYGLFVLPESLPKERRMDFSWRRANPVGSLVLLRRHPELFGLAMVNFLMHCGHYVFHAVFVLYAVHRYDWGPWQVGAVLAFSGALDVLVQSTLVGPVSKRLGDRWTLVLGLAGGGIGLVAIGLAPDGILFALAMLPTALWGLAMPTSQSLMTRRVSASEQGQLQGANSSIISIAGLVSPVVMGSVYALAVGPYAGWNLPGAPFLLAGLILAAATLLAWRVTRAASLAEAAAPGVSQA